MLDGLRFDALVGENGEKAGANGADGKYVEPKVAYHRHDADDVRALAARAQGLVGQELKNVPQQIGAAFKDESFYTQAISTDAGGRQVRRTADCQSELSAQRQPHRDAGGANPGRHPRCRRRSVRFGAGERQGLYRLWIDRAQVQVPACLAIKAGYNKKAEKAADDLQSNRIDRKAYDKLGDLRQQGEEAYKRCFPSAPRSSRRSLRPPASRGAAGGGDGK